MNFAYLIEPPFNYRTEAGAITGCDVELAKWVLGDIGVDDFGLIETEFSKLIPGLNDGRWRMTTGLFGTDERRQWATFSRPIWALPDGLLVRQGNPTGLSGYRSLADTGFGKLAVIRDQAQHQTALDLGVPAEHVQIFDTYSQAAEAVLNGTVVAYASVARAHTGFIERQPDLALDVVPVPQVEKEPAFGSFAFAKNDSLKESVNEALDTFLGTEEHRAMVARFGFSMAEVDLVVERVG